MVFWLLLVLAFVPFFIGVAQFSLSKDSRVGKPILASLFFVTCWQIDVCVLFTPNSLSPDTAVLLFKFFRFGQIFTPFTALLVTYKLVNSPTLMPDNLMTRTMRATIAHKRFVVGYLFWSIFVYIISWTPFGIKSLEYVSDINGEVFYYPSYGEMGYIYYAHLLSFMVIGITNVVASLAMQETYHRQFMRIYTVCTFVCFFLGIFNLSKDTGLIIGNLSVVIYSTIIVFSFNRIYTGYQRSIEMGMMNVDRVGYADSILRNLVHELRNALVGVSITPALIARTQDLDERGKKYVNELMSASAHASSLVDQFADFVKDGRLNKSMNSISDIVAESVNMISSLALSKDVTVSYTDEPDAKVYVDPIRLKQVIINLAKNAIEAFGEQHEDPQVSIEYVIEKDQSVRISIKDNGSGIDKYMVDDLFSLYRTSKEGGSGIGLALCRHIAMAHGGNVSLGSTSSEGTEMVVIIPGALEEREESENV